MGHSVMLWSVYISPNNESLISGSYEKKARLWAWDQETPVLEIEGHEKSVLATAFDPTGKYYLTGSLDQTILQWGADSTR
ncbi:MAG: hypothetical protein HC896_07585 [Bacteroidales bacterium]|nr:hypothetical protein [Bacteroidales bacterium]